PRRGRAPRALAGPRDPAAPASRAQTPRPDGPLVLRPDRARVGLRGVAVRARAGRRSLLHAGRCRQLRRDVAAQRRALADGLRTVAAAGTLLRARRAGG